jgi:hypothetical protein
MARPTSWSVCWCAIAVVATIAVVGAGAWHERALAVDDAYISYRYAHHLATGHGLRWNLDGAPNEGFTNLLYVVAVAAADAVGFDPVAAGLWIGIAGAVALAVLLALADRPREVAAPVGAAIILWFLARPELRVHASRGLETTLFGALAVALVMLGGRVARATGPCVRDACGLGLLSLLLCLCRPDGALIVVATWSFVGGAHLLRRRSGRARIGDVAIGAAVGVVLLAAYATWKRAYFGYLLPNSFYAKVRAGSWAGIDDTRRFFAEYAAVFAVGGALCVAQIVRALARRGSRPLAGAPAPVVEIRPALVLTIVVGWTIFSLRIVHEMGFAYRFDYPMVPLLALGSIAALHDLARDFEPTPRLRFAALALGLAASGCAIPTLRSELAGLSRPVAEDPYGSCFARLGRSLHEIADGRPLTLVCGHAGATPYYAEVRHVDPFGLVDDGFCPRTPPDERERYRRSLRPDVIVWNLFPAAPGATSLDDDARAMASTYIRAWYLGDSNDLDAGARQERSRSNLRLLKYQMHERMAFFRDGCTFVGEIDYGLPRWREFVYVWNDSPRRDELIAKLRACVDVPADAITYDGWPSAPH